MLASVKTANVQVLIVESYSQGNVVDSNLGAMRILGNVSFNHH